MGGLEVLLITPGERTALQLLANGKPAHEIAHCLGIHHHDIERSLLILFTRMGAAGPAEAIAAGFRRGLLNREEPPATVQ
jgi:DNA-binding CsgD family transcriptional regulator